MSEPYWYPDSNMSSTCCSAPPASEIVEGIALCSKCKEWSDFESEVEEE